MVWSEVGIGGDGAAHRSAHSSSKGGTIVSLILQLTYNICLVIRTASRTLCAHIFI